MRVAFISRATLYSSPGGDTRQMEQTALHLQKLGVDADIYLADQSIEYSKYDLLHFFNIIRPADMIRHIEISAKPYVVSTIFVDYKDSRDKLSTLKSEYLKVLARAVKNNERVVSRQYLWWGHNRSVRYVAEHAGCLLPNSESEFNRLVAAYGISSDHIVVPNGIDIEMLRKTYPSNDTYKDAIICMGRIEPRKNQLNLIRALNGTVYRLYIHGKPSPNHGAYYRQCLAEAKNNVVLCDWLEDDTLYSVYNAARVHVLPSYFETTGLSTLEAAAMGCNIVITDKGDTREYFGASAWYCEPDNIASIRAAVDDAYVAPYNTGFRQYILDNYTWQRAAEKTLEAYYHVLNR